VAEEVRVFIRIALYVVGIGIVYWAVSYEEAGTALLWFLGAGAIFFAVTVQWLLRGAPDSEKEPGRGPVTALNRAVGFAERPRDELRGALDIEEEPIPPSSVWPAAAALGALFVALGLIYGPWFWLPGAGLALLSAWGWLTELTR
jgi:hypothetical protein